MNHTSQNQKVLNHLASGKTITALQALQWWGVMRLARCIGDLRQQGYPIKSTPVKRAGKRFAQYSLEA